MGWTFITYLVLKGLKQVWSSLIQVLNDVFLLSLEVTSKPSFATATLLGSIVAIVVYFVVKKRLKKKLFSPNFLVKHFNVVILADSSELDLI